jgi:uncharacterized NAD-dependent epimerase/dehydratase family protein
MLSILSEKAKIIPIFVNTTEALNKLGYKPEYCVIGVAPCRGKISESLAAIVMEAIAAKMNIVNGLHTLLNEHLRISLLVKENNVRLIDIRTPKKYSELHPWSGRIVDISIPIVPVITRLRKNILVVILIKLTKF